MFNQFSYRILCTFLHYLGGHFSKNVQKFAFLYLFFHRKMLRTASRQKRFPPGTSKNFDFKPFFKTLRKAGSSS